MSPALARAIRASGPAFAKRIHELSEAYIGEIAELLMRAAVKAIVTKKERIDRTMPYASHG